GDAWDQWNKQIQQVLVPTQAREGHLLGSWYLPGDHGSRPKGVNGLSPAGRLYCTVMALLCLEEHFRLMQLFQNAGGNQQALKNPGAAGKKAAGQGGGFGGGGPLPRNGGGVNKAAEILDNAPSFERPAGPAQPAE